MHCIINLQLHHLMFSQIPDLLLLIMKVVFSKHELLKINQLQNNPCVLNKMENIGTNCDLRKSSCESMKSYREVKYLKDS